MISSVQAGGEWMEQGVYQLCLLAGEGHRPYTSSSGASLVGIFFFQAEDGIRDYKVTGVQTCALPICFSGWARDWARPSSLTAWSSPPKSGICLTSAAAPSRITSASAAAGDSAPGSGAARFLT